MSTATMTAAAPQPAPMARISVNGVAITRRAIAAEVQNFSADTAAASWDAAARALVIRELLRQEAVRLSLVREPRTDADGRIETEEDALVRALIEHEVRTPEADETVLRRYYDRNRQRFLAPPLYEAEHILFAADRTDRRALTAAQQKAAAVTILLERNPQRFAELAHDVSDCPSREVGGYLGQVGSDDVTPEFAAALAELEPGDISAPIETRYGVHLIRLARRLDSRELPFEAVRDRIAHYLEAHARRYALVQYVALLVGRAEIKGIEMAALRALLDIALHPAAACAHG
jgi:peptidyl-prolyl cis-trans isomerase C